MVRVALTGRCWPATLEDERAEGIEHKELVDPRAPTEVRMRVDQARENRIGVAEELARLGSATAVAVIASIVAR